MAIDTIKFKRGVKSKLNNLSYGEPAYISDENELYIGTEDGVEKITRNKEVAELSSQLEQKVNKKDSKIDKYLSNSTTSTRLENAKFHRLFTKSSYKDIKMNIGRVDYSNDFRNVTSGNLYNYTCDGEADYLFSDNKMSIRNPNNDTYHSFSYFVGRFKPFCNFEINISNFVASDNYNNRIGFCFHFPDGNSQFITIARRKDEDSLFIIEESFINGSSNGNNVIKTIGYSDNISLIVQYYSDNFEIYTKENNHIIYQCTHKRTDLIRFMNKNYINNFKANVWGILKGGSSVSLSDTNCYYDLGIAQADIRNIKYEDGCPIMENGYIYFTLSARTQTTAYQAICKWKIDTDILEMTGLILFSYDNVNITQDVASCLVYDRYNKEWIIWNTSHNHGHISARTKLYNDVRYGYNIISTEQVETESYIDGKYVITDDTSFFGKTGDEDVDIIFDKENNIWYLILCRLIYRESYNRTVYTYQLYKSDNPVNGFKYVGEQTQTSTGEVTGGCIIRYGGKFMMICGTIENDNPTTSQYNVYELNDFKTYVTLNMDIKDGGHRGWGMVVPIPSGNSTRYIMVTFDRALKSSSKWSYGNMYFYELDVINDGFEYDITYSI